MNDSFNIFEYPKGCIEAPAGCGKTQLIVDSIEKNNNQNTALVLTHTNAGVAALKQRFRKKGILHLKVKITTIDSFLIRLVRTFPQRSALPKDYFLNKDIDYTYIRKLALSLLGKEFINTLISNTYSYIFVDEYQDCSELQHHCVVTLSSSIPTYVFGDPLQSIFNFRNSKVVSWETVLKDFPPIHKLMTPWRWINSGTKPLGDWLLSIRKDLINHKKPDLYTAPRNYVRFIPREYKNFNLDYLYNTKDSYLIIGPSYNEKLRLLIAKRNPRVTPVEPVELKALIDLVANFDIQGDSTESLKSILKIASETMTNTNIRELEKRINSIENKRNRNPPNRLEVLCMRFKEQPNFHLMKLILEEFKNTTGIRVIRPTTYLCLIRAIQRSEDNQCSLYDSAILEREKLRHQEKYIPPVAIGSTLLLKGLEADVSVVTNYNDLDLNNLYVALTRGSKRIIIYT